MNYNLITYCIYLPIIIFIMVKIGWLFYKNGEVFLLNLFQNNSELVKSINNLLLIGYYLTNIGYAIITIAYWEYVDSAIEMLNSLSHTIGKIILLLALMHYNNIFWLKHLNKSKLLNQ
ncbi:hypothetical protein [Winogradskyella jejuensis]|uniref:Integral membrane protein n=1 Tax=Winogradskyella jejuensis TaxID=1089305 RepID=A0A1M5RIX6_9FLAO|nr:hypothetical protein [Winogradskyella jejuensis]SHH26106.1 hypothetical protein SAMN05444148_1599 [Winogradskyella jejuensis]